MICENCKCKINDGSVIQGHFNFCKAGLKGIKLEKLNNISWQGIIEYDNFRVSDSSNVQRIIDWDKIEENCQLLLQEFEEYSFILILNPLQLTYKNQKLWINDGQHLYYAIKKAIQIKPECAQHLKIPLIIIQVQSDEEEKKLFLKTNRRVSQSKLHEGSLEQTNQKLNIPLLLKGVGPLLQQKYPNLKFDVDVNQQVKRPHYNGNHLFELFITHEILNEQSISPESILMLFEKFNELKMDTIKIVFEKMKYPVKEQKSIELQYNKIKVQYERSYHILGSFIGPTKATTKQILDLHDKTNNVILNLIQSLLIDSNTF